MGGTSRIWSGTCGAGCFQMEQSFLPIYNALLVKKFETRDDFSCIETRSILVEATALLDVEHQVASVQILHHEE